MVRSPYESVKDIKESIQGEIGLRVERQRLVHSGSTLLDDDDLDNGDIHDGDTIYLVLKSGGKINEFGIHVQLTYIANNKRETDS